MAKTRYVTITLTAGEAAEVASALYDAAQMTAEQLDDLRRRNNSGEEWVRASARMRSQDLRSIKRAYAKVNHARLAGRR